MNSNKNPCEFTVVQLKDILKAKGLSAVGAKNDLINRLMMSDPTGAWMDEETCDGSDKIASENWGANMEPNANSPRPPTPPIETTDARSMDILRKERELAEREIELLKREVEMMRKMQRLNIGGQSVSQNVAMYSGQHTSALVNESMKSMLNYFDGSSQTLDAWERQLALLRATYRLDDNAAKLLAVSRLKNQALEWFHSKPEHVGMCIDDLVKELKDIFGDRQDRIAARREFECRIWKKEETFAEYFHCKVILANRIRIDEEELIEYLIDGIPDHSLRNHAKLQKFKSQASILEAFRGVTLVPSADEGTRFSIDVREQSWRRNTVLQRREVGTQRFDSAVQRGNVATWRAPPGPRRWEEFQRWDNASRWRDEKIQRHDDGVQRHDDRVQRRDYGMQQRHYDQSQQQEARDAEPGRCYNCGERDHFFYDCPLKKKGSKCFECKEFGHVAANCPTKRTPTTGESFTVWKVCPRKKYFEKEIQAEIIQNKVDPAEILSVSAVVPTEISNEIAVDQTEISNEVVEDEAKISSEVAVDQEETLNEIVEGQMNIPETSEAKIEVFMNRQTADVTVVLSKKSDISPMVEDEGIEDAVDKPPFEQLLLPESEEKMRQFLKRFTHEVTVYMSYFKHCKDTADQEIKVVGRRMVMSTYRVLGKDKQRRRKEPPPPKLVIVKRPRVRKKFKRKKPAKGAKGKSATMRYLRADIPAGWPSVGCE